MDLRRIFRHLATTAVQVRRAFSGPTLMAIEQAIRASETAHRGEIRFVVEGALEFAPLWHGQGARERAIDLFSQLRIWDTEHNTGVLIYVLLADRQVELLADRGIHAKAGSRLWDAICRDMEVSFRAGDFEAGAVRGITAVGRELSRHFPAHASDLNELPDAPILL